MANIAVERLFKYKGFTKRNSRPTILQLSFQNVNQIGYKIGRNSLNKFLKISFSENVNFRLSILRNNFVYRMFRESWNS